MKRTSWLLVGLTVALLAQVAAGAATEGQPNQYISLDLEDVSLEEALGALFQGTPYTFTLEPGLEDDRLTITLSEVTFGQALRAILSMHHLTYTQSGDAYSIARSELDLTRSVTVDLQDVPIGTALDALFEDIPVRYVLAPGMESVRVSVHAEEEQCCAVLMDVLDQADLTCDLEDDVLHILSMEAAEAEATEFRRQREIAWAMQSIPKGKHRALYIADYGRRDQLRVRVFPYQGNDAVLWQSPAGGRIRYFLPSPDWTRALVVWEQRGTQRVAIVYFLDGAAEEAAELRDVGWVLWRDVETIAAFGSAPGETTEYAYDTTEMTLSVPEEQVADRPDEDDPELAFLSRGLEEAIGMVRAMLDEDDLAVPIRPRDVTGSLVRGAGIPYVPPAALGLPVAHPIAAVSADGEHVALTTGRSKDAVFVISRYHVYGTDYSSRVLNVIPLSSLVSGEGVWVSDLQWSPDGQHLLFTEVHYHPARFHAPDIGGDVPDPLDWTYLVRMYSLRGEETRTIIVGRQGCLMPRAEMSQPPEGDE
jgi:hypothetical protein